MNSSGITSNRVWRGVKVAAIGVAVTGLLLTAIFMLLHLTMTGRPWPQTIVDSLDSPVQVQHWSEQGLVLADGRTVQLPGFDALPGDSSLLEHAVQRGVEVDEQGRVYALIRIHHWCGNDPVRKHIARVDLAHLLMFFDQGEYVLPTLASPWEESAEMHRGSVTDSAFSEHGLRVGHFATFRTTSQLLSDESVP